MFLAGSLFLLTGRAFAVPQRVAVVVSDDLAIYTEPAEAFLAQFPEHPRVYQLHGRPPDPASSLELSTWNPQVVVCVGPKAAYAVKAALPSTPLVYVAILDPKRYGIEGNQVTGVTMTVDPVTFVSQFTGFFPDVQRIGVVRGPATGDARAEAMTHAATELGKELVVATVAEPGEVRKALGSLVDQDIDALWLPDDRDVVTTNVYRTLAEEARRRHLPVLVDTTSMARVGGTFTMVPDPAGMARQAAVLVSAILDGAAPAILPPVAPEDLLVVLNVHSLDAAGLAVDPLLLDFVDVAL